MAKVSTLVTAKELGELAKKYKLEDNAAWSAATQSYLKLQENLDILQGQVGRLRDADEPETMKLLNSSISMSNKTAETMNKLLQTIVTLIRKVGETEEPAPVEKERDPFEEFILKR